ncbi:carbohydrate kinase family protein [Nocardiopsis sp. FIRDI 009]|uniref:carbohydrate kinase family protein n=1 Tax=Nocardiopsis sp. FIRDI 009 TaxID=714197 RepID=UPI000E22952B|nr:carbohydrate kinase family protein [Nocardiopsis sp. FIRDI 009]
MTDTPRIVVAGVANLCTAAQVETTAPATPDHRGFTDHMVTGVSGVGANVAATLRRLGTDVDLCTLVGEDTAGRAVRAGLEREGLLGPGCVPAASSPLAVSLVGADGRQLGYTFLGPLAGAAYPTEVFLDLVSGADLAVLTTIGFARPLIHHARRAGVPIAVDVHVIADIHRPEQRAWLHSADILFCSHERLPGPPREWIRQVFDTYPGCAVAGVGRGSDGAVVGLRDGTLVSARTDPPRPLVNTVGAGDTLFASFLHGWVSAGNPVQALHDAVLHASWAIGDLFPNDGHLERGNLSELAHAHPVQVDVDRW